jgi:tetratricopeptide (TPR) repeat protein
MKLKCKLQQVVQFREHVAHAQAHMDASTRRDVAPLLYQRVRIDGIVARPELNGAFGKVISWSDDRGRYGVRLEQGGEQVALKPANLTAAGAADGAVPCLHCGAENATICCTQCFSVWYCNADCQQHGWPAHAAFCREPPVSEWRGEASEMSHAQQAKIQTHLEASIAAGKGQGKAAKLQEIKMLKQAAAAEPNQPFTWFNLSQAYMEMGAKQEAVEAMDRAVFYMLQTLRPGAVDMSDPAFAEGVARAQLDMVTTGARMLQDAVVGRAHDELSADESLGKRLVELAGHCGTRLPPGAHSLVHHVYGNVLRKRSANAEALVQLRKADAAAWDGGKGKRDLASLSVIPDVIANAAMSERTADARRAHLIAAVDAAREALDAIPSEHPMRLSAQLGLCRMISQRIASSAEDPARHESTEDLQTLRQEGVALCQDATLAAQRIGDARLLSMAQALLAPGAPLGGAAA